MKNKLTSIGLIVMVIVSMFNANAIHAEGMEPTTRALTGDFLTQVELSDKNGTLYSNETVAPGVSNVEERTGRTNAKLSFTFLQTIAAGETYTYVLPPELLVNEGKTEMVDNDRARITLDPDTHSVIIEFLETVTNVVYTFELTTHFIAFPDGDSTQKSIDFNTINPTDGQFNFDFIPNVAPLTLQSTITNPNPTTVHYESYVNMKKQNADNTIVIDLNEDANIAFDLTNFKIEQGEVSIGGLLIGTPITLNNPSDYTLTQSNGQLIVTLNSHSIEKGYRISYDATTQKAAPSYTVVSKVTHGINQANKNDLAFFVDGEHIQKSGTLTEKSKIDWIVSFNQDGQLLKKGTYLKDIVSDPLEITQEWDSSMKISRYRVTGGTVMYDGNGSADWNYSNGIGKMIYIGAETTEYSYIFEYSTGFRGYEPRSVKNTVEEYINNTKSSSAEATVVIEGAVVFKSGDPLKLDEYNKTQSWKMQVNTDKSLGSQIEPGILIRDIYGSGVIGLVGQKVKVTRYEDIGGNVQSEVLTQDTHYSLQILDNGAGRETGFVVNPIVPLKGYIVIEYDTHIDIDEALASGGLLRNTVEVVEPGKTHSTEAKPIRVSPTIGRVLKRGVSDINKGTIDWYIQLNRANLNLDTEMLVRDIFGANNVMQGFQFVPESVKVYEPVDLKKGYPTTEILSGDPRFPTATNITDSIFEMNFLLNRESVIVKVTTKLKQLDNSIYYLGSSSVLPNGSVPFGNNATDGVVTTGAVVFGLIPDFLNKDVTTTTYVNTLNWESTIKASPLLNLKNAVIEETVSSTGNHTRVNPSSVKVKDWKGDLVDPFDYDVVMTPTGFTVTFKNNLAVIDKNTAELTTATYVLNYDTIQVNRMLLLHRLRFVRIH